MIQTFACPSCGAPLEYKSASHTIRCHFCSNEVILPRELRHGAPGHGAPRVSGRKVLILVGAIIALVGFLAFGLVLSLLSQRPTISAPVQPPNSRPESPRTTKPEPTGFAPLSMSFGSEGIGPGQFKDARSIALDAQGHIYVGEYIGGRVQVFDSAGTFVTQWMVDTKMPLRGIAADRKGTVYVVQKGAITRYEGLTGNKTGDLDYPEGWGFDDVTSTADGGLVAAWYRNRDDIVRFDASGRTTKKIERAISGQTDSSELNTRVAADGLGNIYALGSFNNGVFKFNPDGKFVNKFGGDGDGQGQFRAPSAIAADGQGRVYVCDFKGVQVFDSDGRYLGVIKVKGAASGLAFNDVGELFVVARTQVHKFSVPRQ